MKNWRELKPHPLNLFPPMQGWEFEELKESIAKGYDKRNPIVVHIMDNGGRGIIDGANRHRACIETNIVPIIREFYGSYQDVYDFIIQSNNRRSLTAGQKVAVILDMGGIVSEFQRQAAESRTNNLPNKNKPKKRPPKVSTAKSIAKLSDVGERTVYQTAKVKKVDPELYEAVKEGKISAKSAYNQIQDKIIEADKDLKMQREAKKLLKKAVHDALERQKHELYEYALSVVERVYDTNASEFKFELGLEVVKDGNYSVQDFKLDDIDIESVREANIKNKEANRQKELDKRPVSPASLIDYHKATKTSPAIKK